MRKPAFWLMGVALIVLIFGFGLRYSMAQTFNITGALNGLPGGNYNLSNTTAVLNSDGSYTVNGTLVPATGIGNPTLAGKNTGSTNNLATTVDIPAGSLVVVTATPGAGTGSLTGISDGINTYALVDGTTDQFATKMFFCSNCAHIPSGTTFSASGSDGAPTIMSIIFASGVNGGLDQHMHWNMTTAGTSISETLPTLSTSPELIIEATQPFQGAVSGYTESSGFTTLLPMDNTTAIVGEAFVIVNGTTPPTFAPHWTGNHSVNGVMASFKKG